MISVLDTDTDKETNIAHIKTLHMEFAMLSSVSLLEVPCESHSMVD